MTNFIMARNYNNLSNSCSFSPREIKQKKNSKFNIIDLDKSSINRNWRYENSVFVIIIIHVSARVYMTRLSGMGSWRPCPHLETSKTRYFPWDLFFFRRPWGVHRRDADHSPTVCNRRPSQAPRRHSRSHRGTIPLRNNGFRKKKKQYQSTIPYRRVIVAKDMREYDLKFFPDKISIDY